MKIDTALADNETLINAYKNAYVTYAQCGGHTKAAWNKVFMEEYAEEITRRGLTLPQDIDTGVFNGKGAF